MTINQLDMSAVFNNALGTVAAHRGMQQQQEYRNFLRDNGEALMEGDPGALAGYAQYDPGGALSMRNNMNSERRASQLHERKMAEIASNMSAQERAQELQTVRMGIQAGANARTPEEWDATVGSIAPGLKGRFGERETLINQAMTWEQFLSSQAPQEPADEYGRYVAEETAAGREPLSRIDFAKAKHKSSEIRVGPDGSVSIVEGGGAGRDTAGLDVSGPPAMIRSIDGILEDPALDWSTGFLQFMQQVPGTGGRRVGARIDQLNGQAFLNAFESLKGGGQITEIEGEKATSAVGRLDSAQRPEDYRAALSELRELLVLGQSRPKGWVGNREQSIPDVGTVEGGYRFLGGDPASPSSWEKVE